MGQRFFTNNIESKFIKNLLSNTYLPVFKAVTDGDFLLSGNRYVYNDKVILCTYSGYLFENELNVENKSTCVYTVLPGEVERKMPYKSPYSEYDSDTHKELGKYLRYLRASSGINLLPYYNCFSYKGTSDFYLSETDGIIYGNNQFYKVLLVPIVFNREYSIHIDSIHGVMLKSVIYSDFGLVKSYMTSDGYLTDLIEEDVIKYDSCSFSNPIRYSVTNDVLGGENPEVSLETAKYLEQHEDELYLVIQLPVENKSAIVVIEGECSTPKYISNGDTVFSGVKYRTSDGVMYCENNGTYYTNSNSHPLHSRVTDISDSGTNVIFSDNLVFDDENGIYIPKSLSSQMYDYDGVLYTYSADSVSAHLDVSDIVVDDNIICDESVIVGSSITSPNNVYKQVLICGDESVDDNKKVSEYRIIGVNVNTPYNKYRYSKLVSSGYIKSCGLSMGDIFFATYTGVVEVVDRVLVGIALEDIDEGTLVPFDSDSILLFADMPVEKFASGEVDSLVPILYRVGNISKLYKMSNTFNLHTKSSLSMLNNGVTYAFSDRLIEYLLGNVIDSLDNIQNNMLIASEYAGVDKKLYFDSNMQISIFNQYVENNENSMDISGFIDKDVEKYFEKNRIKKTNSEWVGE